MTLSIEVTSTMIDTFRSFFPEFDASDDVQIQGMINYALLYINPEEWGARYTYGWLYLAAHHLYIRLQVIKGQVKPILGGLSGVSAGEVSTTYTAGGDYYNTADDALLLQTQYGAEYVQMRNAIIVKVFNYGGV